jgi:hypothetical protein
MQSKPVAKEKRPGRQQSRALISIHEGVVLNQPVRIDRRQVKK